jgi:FKBP-type peptidyl-prolyl cis-trans isomerase 2
MLMVGCVLLLGAFSGCSEKPLATFGTTDPSTYAPKIQMAKDGDTVTVHYVGKLDSGDVFDSSRERGEPIRFVVGSGQMIAGFDATVNGLMVGKIVSVRLDPEEAYGKPDDELIREFPIEQLPEGLADGDSVTFQSGAKGLIRNVTDTTFKVDANHSLAGKYLTFEIELVSIQ